MNKKLTIFALLLSFIMIAGVGYWGYINFLAPWMSSISNTSSLSDDNTYYDTNVSDSEFEAGIVTDEEFPTGALPDSNVLATVSATLTTQQMVLPVEYISQLPELPTGCEITSLATVLNYLGYTVDKEYLAENYLAMLDDLDGSFENYFIGSPWDPNSWGCFAPAIIKAANAYLADVSSEKKAYNISGYTPEQLFAEVQSGNPVIVWITSNLEERTTFSYVELNNGRFFKWPAYEHCVVLIGYDLKAPKSVTLSDPLEGIVTRKYTLFSSRYRELNRRAVVIK